MLFSAKDLRKIIIPLLIQQILTVMVGMADSMMVASAGEAAVSGVSLVGSLDLLLIYIFTSLATGGAVVISQLLGRREPERANEAAKQLLYSTTIIAVLVTTVVLIFRHPLLHALFGDAEAAVMQNALDYFFFISLSFPFLAIEVSVSAIFRSMGNSMISMLVSLLINLINIAGNAVLIFGFEMGAEGAAIATLISKIIGALIMLIFISRRSYSVHITKIYKYRPDVTMIKNILRIGIPNGIENAMFQFGKLMTQSLISSLGTVAIAANAVAGSMASLQYVPGNSINAAIVPIVGRCIGAGEKKQAKRYSRLLVLITYAILAVVVLVMSVFARPIIGLYGLSDNSADLARQLIIFHGLVAILIWPIGFCLPNVFRAASDVKITLIISAGSMWIFRVVLGYVLALETVSVFGLFSFSGAGMGAMGVWLAMIIDWIFRSAVYLPYYLRGKWLNKFKLK